MKNSISYLSYEFTDVSIKSARIGEEMSLPVASLGIDTLEAEVKCADASIVSFQRDTPLVYSRSGIPSAVYYVQSITRSGRDRYVISAVSSLGRLENIQHMGGIYNGDRAEDVIREICGTVPVLVKTNLRDLAIYGYLPIDTARNNLAQVLFAIGANLTSDLNGVLRVQNMFNGLSSYIGSDREYIGGKAEYSAQVSSVTVIEHSYTAGTGTETIFDGTVTAPQRITFSQPMSGLSATGFTITDSGANYADITAGTGTLTGIPYLHNTREVTQTVSETNVPNEVRVDGATLVSVVNSTAVAQRLAEYYSHNETLRVSTTIDRERPGQVIQIYHPYERKMVSATIAQDELNVSATLKGDIEALVGFEPPQAEEMEYYDTFEILTGSGTWTPPQGVTQATFVLIGGGSGGGKGEDGEAAPTPSPITDSYTTTGYAYIDMGFPNSAMVVASGGASGTPGDGGKVYQVDLELDGSALSYNCGTGGSGEVAGGAAAQAGTDTTLATYSSASGASSPVGYTNPISGTAYAAAGLSGHKGGNGGGRANVDGAWTDVPAEAVSTWAGGQRNASIVEDDAGSISSGCGHIEVYYTGGYGGGAAYGANGENGGEDGHHEFVNTPPTIARVYASHGGKGADAIAPPQTATYGQGGTGGNGGGGAGQFGYPSYISNERVSSLSAPTLHVYANNPVSGGAGSDGGKGGDGCVIAIYRLPVTQPSHGYFIDRNGRFVQGKYHRQITV